MQSRRAVATPHGDRRMFRQYQRVFVSKAEVKAHWSRMLCGSSEGLPRSATGLSRDVKIAYLPGNGWRYTISLARPSDAGDLTRLSDEFVQTHKALFSAEYGDVDLEAWRRYLGLPSEAARSQAHAVANASNPPGQTARLNIHAFKDGGCVLKCEAVRETGSGPHSPRAEAAAPSQTVGYVHFTLEEGGAHDGGQRTSMRLKRKRGEHTGEYTKVNHLIVAAAHRGVGLGQALLAAMLECVRCLEPAYGHELFLTAMQRNEEAVRLYEHLGLRVFGENVTHLTRSGAGDHSRPVVWYQIGLCATGTSEGSPSPGGTEQPDRARRKLRRSVTGSSSGR
mmetsp:Transcript_132309/g.382520  ORF Transcript_132309/g.382520 Transcript_132309/m.382520 type:complete len:337 (-) Transcript_132309:61-1071(-)